MVEFVRSNKRYARKETNKIYLGAPYFNDVQKKRVEEASKLLNYNLSVGVIHEPFDFQYKDVSIDKDEEGIFGSLEWQVATYQNDLSAMETSDVGVFLYDLDSEDSGSAFEIGFMRALHKPVVAVLLSENHDDKQVNLMLARSITAFIPSVSELGSYDFNHTPSNPVCPYPVF